MNLKDIKQKIFEVLFRKEYWTIQTLQGEVLNKKMKINTLMEEKVSLREEISKLIRESTEVKTPTMADLMREILGSVIVDFINIEGDGLPKHFLNIEDIPKRTLYTAQLHEIWNLEVWKAMCDYYINLQGNFALRQADGELQILSARMTINGISLIQTEVNKGHLEYTERSKPPEDFDKFSVELLNEHN